MHKKLLSLLILFSTLAASAQVKKKQFTFKSIGVSNIAELNNQFDTLSIKNGAVPAPFSSDDFSTKKALLNKQRDQYTRKIDRRTLDTSVALGANLPFVEGGFEDSLFTSSVPNDNHMCVGNNGDIISVLNSTIRVYKGGGNLNYNVGLSYFGRVEPKNSWPNGKQVLTGSYDPKAMYDPVADKYIIAWLDGRTSGDTRIMLAISKTNDAAGSYNIFHLEGNPLEDSSWTDYPILSQSGADVFITVNLLRDGGSWQTSFKQSVIWQISKLGLYKDNEVKTSLWHNIKHNNKSIWSICPVDQYYKSYEKEMYFLSVRPSSLNNDTLFLHKLSNTHDNGNAAYSYKVLTTSEAYGIGGSAYQLSSGNARLQTNDSRILTAISYYGHIQYAHNCINFSTTAPSIMHGYIDDPSAFEPQVKNQLISSDSLDFGYPSMAYLGSGNSNHTSMLSFSHSSKTAFPGISLVKIDSAYATVSPIIRVKTGTKIINSFLPDSTERWGDYTGIQRKYNEEGVFFLSNSVGIDGKNNAGTYIGRLRYDPRDMGFKDETAIAFPNPSSDGFYYLKFSTLNDRTNDYYQITVIDLGSGKKVYENPLVAVECGELVMKLNLSFLSHGTYQLQLTRKNDLEGDLYLFNEKIQRY